MLSIQYRPIADLIPYARNMNSHDEAHVAEIAASIKEFGWTSAILIDKDCSIVAGHGRLLAARQLGMAEVPTIQRDHWTPAQVKAYRIADNQIPRNAEIKLDMLGLELEELKGDGFDLGLLGFDDSELDKYLNGSPEFEPDLPSEDEGGLPEAKLCLRIDFDDAEAQQNLFLELRDRGFKVKV